MLVSPTRATLGRMGLHALAIVTAMAVAVLAFLAFGARAEEPDADAARLVALHWTQAERADPPRRDGELWEVDVRRPDGSLVEVTLGRDLELHELDEELGPGGSLPWDELTGALRERAIAAARPAGGPGAVLGVERERDGTIEVGFARPGGSIAEVELDRRLRVQDVDEEHAGDE